MIRLQRSSRSWIAMAVFAPLLAACGIVESIAEGQIDDRDVTVVASSSLSGTLERRLDGTDVLAVPTILRAGDQADNDFELAVMSFAIEPSLQPGSTRLKRIRLRIWVTGNEGDPMSMFPLLMAHLPGHPTSPLMAGMLPNPPTSFVGELADPVQGWHEFDVTDAFRLDWDAGRSVSAFTIFCSTASDNNSSLDAVRFGYEGEPGGGPAPELILTFGADVDL